MTRVSSYGNSQVLLGYMLQAQGRVLASQEQVSSGYKSQTYKGIARDSVALEGAKALQQRIETYVKNNRLIENRVDTYDIALRGLGDIADELRQDVTSAIANNSGTALIGKVRDLFNRAVDILNAQVDSRYIFAGSRTDTTPITIVSPDDLITAPSIAGLFANDSTQITAQLDDSLTVTYGVLASDVATELFTQMQRILQFDSGTLPSGAGAYAPAGAFQNPLTTNQKDFLLAELPGLKSMVDGVQDVVAANGVIAKSISDVQDRQGQTLITTKAFIGELRDVDAAEAISNLNRDQTALQASYQVVSQLSALNLLNFLR